jgi:hypothetical protein
MARRPARQQLGVKAPGMSDGGNVPQPEGLRHQQGTEQSSLPAQDRREINRRLLEVERVSHNSNWSGGSIQRVVQPTVTQGGEKAPSLKSGQPRVMTLLLALTLFQHLVEGFHNHDLRGLVTIRWWACGSSGMRCTGGNGFWGCGRGAD